MTTTQDIARGEKMALAAPVGRLEIRWRPSRIRSPLAGRKIHSPADIAALFWWMENLPEERLFAVNLDDSNRLRHFAEVARGGSSGLSVSVRDVLRPALLTNCRSLVLVHNHPQAEPIPSPQDRRFTRQVMRACAALGLRFHEHIIMGWGGRFHLMLAGHDAQLPALEQPSLALA